MKIVVDDEVKYDMLKNLAWARLEQERFVEAEVYLKDAIDTFDDKAPAHCLLAQVLEAQADETAAKEEWEQCLSLSSMLVPDEDEWIKMARDFLGGE